MSLNQIKALSQLGGIRSLGWDDRRNRSPKALEDFSGVILSKVTTQGQAAVQEFDYDLLSQIYVCNDLAWTCINLVSSTAALGKLKVKKKSGTALEYLPDHPLQLVLDFPNSSMTQFDLIQSYVVHQMLFGTVSILLLRQDMESKCAICVEDNNDECSHQLFIDSTSPVLELMPVHPSNIKIIWVPKLQKRCFFYVPNLQTGRKYLIHPNNILTDPYYNPDVSWYGVSPTFLLNRWLKLDSAMTAQTTAYFENGSIPSMIVSLKPGTNFTYEDEPATLVEKMKQSWMNQFNANSSTKKAPAFVYGDIDVQKLQERINDTVGKDLYYQIESRIAATYGVPPTLFEFGLRYGAQRANAEQGEKDFYNRTISKILVRIRDKINQLVVPSFNDPDIEVVWDLSEMGIAAFLQQTREKRIEEHWKLGLLKRNRAQALLGHAVEADEFSDDYYRITVMGDGQGTETTNQLDKNLQVASDKSE